MRTKSRAITSQAAFFLWSTMPRRRAACRTLGKSDPELVLARRVLDWLAGEWSGRPLISVPDLYTSGPNPVREKKTATRIIGILEDHGWLVRQDGPARVNGTMRREVWRLVSGAAR
jgi:hypothetical protein